MKKLVIIIPYDYKLLSIAAILDVFETVNRIYAGNNMPQPFEIHVIQTSEQITEYGNSFHGYTVEPLKAGTKADYSVIPSFTTANMKDTISKNELYIPWLNQKYKEGAELQVFAQALFLFGASGLLDGKAATTHMDASGTFASLFQRL